MKLIDIIKIKPEKWETIPELNEIPEGTYLIHCDAGYKDGAAGISVIVKKRNKEYQPKNFSRRAKGPVHSELMAVYYGIKEIEKIELCPKKVIILTDSLYACYFLVGFWRPRKKYIMEILAKINFYEALFQIQYIKVDGKINKRVDRKAKIARNVAKDEIDNNIEKRVMMVEEAMKKSKEIIIEEMNGLFYAHSSKNDGTKYLVSLNPPHCECLGWNKKWEKVSEEGKIKRRLPCKHICRLVNYLDGDVFKIFRKVIESRY